MNRRSLLLGLLAAPLAPKVAKTVPFPPKLVGRWEWDIPSPVRGGPWPALWITGDGRVLSMEGDKVVDMTEPAPPAKLPVPPVIIWDAR